MKKLKRILALLVVMTMVVSNVPMVAQAEPLTDCEDSCIIDEVNSVFVNYNNGYEVPQLVDGVYEL